jgi:crossover junction endodeoxyribonuclease RuvC
VTAEALELPGLAGLRNDTAAGTVEEAAPAARVIGIDLSLTGTGMSDGATTWLIRSAGKKDDDLTTRWVRLRKVAREVCDRIPADVSLVAIEAPAFSRTNGHMHDRSGLWWLVVSALHAAAVPVVEITPSSVKKYATGRGNADKGAMVDSAARRYPDVETGANDNRVDALFIAAMALDHLTGLHIVPEAHRVSLNAVRWPS